MYGGTCEFTSYCSPCQRTFNSTPLRPAREHSRSRRPAPARSRRTRGWKYWRDPADWRFAVADITSKRWHHLRPLLIAWAGAARYADLAVPAAQPKLITACPGAPVVDLDTLRACYRTCNGDEWRRLCGPGIRAALHGLRPHVVRSGGAALARRSRHDSPRHYGRSRIDALRADRTHPHGRSTTSRSGAGSTRRTSRIRCPPALPARASNTEPRRPFVDVAEVVADLDRLAVPLNVDPGPARDALASSGIASSPPRVYDAQRWRR